MNSDPSSSAPEVPDYVVALIEVEIGKLAAKETQRMARDAQLLRTHADFADAATLLERRSGLRSAEAMRAIAHLWPDLYCRYLRNFDFAKELSISAPRGEISPPPVMNP